jgi:hypothetical protein
MKGSSEKTTNLACGFRRANEAGRIRRRAYLNLVPTLLDVGRFLYSSYI